MKKEKVVQAAPKKKQKVVAAPKPKNLDYDHVDFVFDALHNSFDPHQDDTTDQANANFHALWNLYLLAAGWSEEEFWKTYEEQPKTCQDCGSLINKEGDHVDEDGDVIDEDLELPHLHSKTENKPN